MKKALLLFLFLSVYLVFISSCKKDEEKPNNYALITDMDPETPATLRYGEYVRIIHSYKITHPEGARIWIQPYVDGEIAEGYLYSSSNIYSGAGERGVIISVSQGELDEVVVDELRVICETDLDEILYEEFIKVEYTFH